MSDMFLLAREVVTILTDVQVLFSASVDNRVLGVFIQTSHWVWAGMTLAGMVL